MKCTAHITKEYKRAKADCCWPFYSPLWGNWTPNPDAEQYPVCDGDVTVTVLAVDEPYYGGSTAMLELDETCTKCKYPFYKSKPLVQTNYQTYGGWDITGLLEAQETFIID